MTCSTPSARWTTSGPRSRSARGRPGRRRTRSRRGCWRARLRQAGVEDVRIQKPHLNVVGTIPGRERGSVVVGAHHDTVDIPGLRRRERRRLRGGGRARACALAPGQARRARRCGWRSSTPRRRARARSFAADGTRGSRQYVALRRARQSPPGLSRRSGRSRRWCSSTWSATATFRSRARRARTPISMPRSRTPLARPTATPRRSAGETTADRPTTTIRFSAPGSPRST